MGEPRVLVTCHNPTSSGVGDSNPPGRIEWPGHTIVGYLDINDVEGVWNPNWGTYYKGWESAESDLKGSLDIVLAMNCPVAPFLMVEGSLGQFEDPLANDFFLRAASLLKPGGSLVFPRYEEARVLPSALEILRNHLPPREDGAPNSVPNTVRFEVDPMPMPMRVPITQHLKKGTWLNSTRQKPTPIGGNWLVITTPMSGGRRRKTRRRRRSTRKYARSL